MTLLVTGGAGFIGANFIQYWLRKYSADHVVNFDKLTYAGNLENLKEIHGLDSYQFVKADICDPVKVAESVKGVDIIVNFAAESHVDRSIMEPSEFVKTNVVGTQVLLEAAVREGVKRFHHISTDEVYGSLSLSDKKKFTEKTPYNPSSPYAASKASSDHLVRAYHKTFGLPITITNCSNNFGPYQFPEKFIPLAITNLLEGKKVPVYGDGLYVRDWLYVEDHCRAIDVVLQKGEIGETYCIGGLSEDIANISGVEKILHQLGKDDTMIEHVTDRPGHDRRYAIDWSKIKDRLGWQPEHSFDEWIVKTVKWYQEHEKWWKDVKSGAYQKYYEKQYGKS